MEPPAGSRLDASPSPIHHLGMTRRFAHAIASRLTRRRFVANLASRFANRRFAFAVATVSIFSAKGVHIYTHLSALPVVHLVQWGYSFFAQDVALLVLVRLLLDPWLTEGSGWLRTATMTLASIIITYLITVGVVTVSFFAVCGSEIHWRNIGLAGDASSFAMFLSGLASFLLVLFTVLFVACILQEICYVTAGMATDILKWPISFALRRSSSAPTTYSQVPQLDVELASPYEDLEEEEFCSMKSKTSTIILRRLLYLFIGCALLTHVILFLIRPNESALNFLSWTPALLPFVDFTFSSGSLDHLKSIYGSSIERSWDNRTALTKPVSFPWLPERHVPGFGDWYKNKEHYNAAADPLKISNLQDALLPALKDKLADVPIRHVMLILLESTRKDVFPFKKDGVIWERLANSYSNKTLPEEAQAMLASLTSNANFITGDYNDGFEHESKKKRGGINFNNVFTTATYTIKSIAGTMCGITPLMADFNLEYLHHFYQPCLPQIFEAFNRLGHDDDEAESADDFKSFQWRSTFMQSVTKNYDRYVPLLSSMGISPESLVSKESLKSPFAKFGPVDLPDINYFGMADIAVEDYIRDAFVQAKKNNERAFVTHLTSTSHHPFAIPAEEKYTPLGSGLDDISHYLNAIGYDDRWLGKIMDILDDEGVADETLVVLVGDHGVSMPENNILAPYYNPNIGTLRVPLVLSHPKLPAIDVDDAVISSQILPTILDLLRETGSLSKSHTQAASDLVQNYEGQSLIRPIHTSSNETGQGNWHFTVVNPGRAMLSIRDTRQPDWHLVVPIIDNIEWHFTNLMTDPTGAQTLLGFDFVDFLYSVEKSHGVDAAKWVEEAAFMARWWVEENGKRWRYGPYAN
ncbi:sulfatase domain [Trichoderma arundinaceum]|uniref:Sulfatase domain n=1 Tax=Trichoderma arundinaceum TaxID=490622 RepID=A0A395NIV0_TRIAR|nr:sulfatase domain [Trichoderma arundinaceum]